MPFYQNPFQHPEFIGVLPLGDRQHSPDFKVPYNAGRGDDSICVWNQPTYDFTGNDGDGNAKNVLIFNISQNDFKYWITFTVTISGATTSAVTASEVITSLQGVQLFNDLFTASLQKFGDTGKDRIFIKSTKPATSFKFYVSNGQAETVLGFNKRAGVAEVPSYFSRHTIGNLVNYADCQNALILLNPGSSVVDTNVINNAVDRNGTSLHYNASTIQSDADLLRGRSGIFTYTKNTIDGSNRVTAKIEYPAGAKAGDFAKKTTYSYTGTNTFPDKSAEVPYVLTSGDLITPP